MGGGKKTKRKAREGEGEGTRMWNKEGRWGSYACVHVYGKRISWEKESGRGTRIDGKSTQEHDPQPVRNKRSFI